MDNRLPKVLVVEDEAAMREVLGMRLEPWGFEVALAENGKEAVDLAAELEPDIVITDVSLPDVSGLDLLRSLQKDHPRRSIILITAFGSIDAAVDAMKHGARDFLTKPLDYEKLRHCLEDARRDGERRAVAAELEARLDKSGGLGPIVGQSKAMRQLFKMIKILGQNEASAILTGESGTGKELVARTIHELSARARGPLVAINTAAIAEGITESELFGHEKGSFTGAVATKPGCFEQADGGTLFLDEFAEMPIALQPKFLRILEDGRVRRLGGTREVPFDVRLLAATNRDPLKEVAEGRLRQDLYYRLNVFTLKLPPLRERSGDVPLLCQHFVRQFNAKHGMGVEGASEEVLEKLADYPWPGNVRELRNVLERAVILARERWIERRHLPQQIARGRGGSLPVVLPPGATLAQAERLLIQETLRRAANNKAKAARLLGLDVKTIRNKLKIYREESEGR